MGTLLLIGLVGGMVTGVSPCVLPVLPVVLLSGSVGAGERRGAARPYLVIAGMVVSFSAFTLLGSLLLSVLGLPQDALRWAALVVLVVIGLGLVFPWIEFQLERAFAWIPQRPVDPNRGGFLVGLALGAVYAPCAGPVLAAIVVAGSTGRIGIDTVALTLSFAVGATLPLLFFALAGNRITARVKAFRSRQRGIRTAAGIVMIGLAIALVLNVPALLQRSIPDFTSALQNRVADSSVVQQQLSLGGIVNDGNRLLDECHNGATELETCGPAPAIQGISQWLNTPDGAAIDLAALRGKVVLIDFWAYSCINCQRSIPHVVEWYDAYRDAGLEVIGVHTPEYAFEREARNVVSGIDDLGIDYPVALDNDYATWTNYRNRYWPAHYLIDATGTVRHIKFGEGDYDTTEQLIRELLRQANPDVALPETTDTADRTPESNAITPETYFSVGKVINYGGPAPYEPGRRSFDPGVEAAPETFALRGDWDLTYQGIAAVGDNAVIALRYTAADVYLVVGGEGTVTVAHDGATETIPVSGPPTARQLVRLDDVRTGELSVELSRGLNAYAFTYG